MLVAGMGLMFQFRPGNSSETLRDSGAAAKESVVPASVKANESDGPWLASCNYWSGVNTAEAGQLSSSPVVTTAQNGDKQELKAAATGNASCNSGNWEIPDDKAEISVIVATVPDPIHSHLALDFDRSIDAILLAAADNHYLGSYYWLPWRSQINNSSGSDSTANVSKPTDADNARERQPGLIVLRYAPDAADVWHSNFNSVNYYRVVYLFLVAETPSLGVNGNQLRNAFAYEKNLKNSYRAALSILPDPFGREKQGKTDIAANQSQSIDEAGNKDAYKKDCASPAPENKLSIIGPNYSGSASSLHAGVQAALPELGDPCVSITGITGTQVAAQEFDPDPREHTHTYQSFGENISFEQERFLQALAASDYKLNRVAVLSEAGTVFGKSPRSSSNESEKRKNEPLKPGERASDIDLSKREPILNISFPRELSLLRNAEPNQKTEAGSSAPPTPYLNLSLKDYSADDTVPRFSTNQSPLSIEAQLMAIAHQLQRARIQFIVISASNILDDIFLADFLHRACPDARLVIFSGDDLLFERDVDDAKYVGSLAISPYLLNSLDFGNHVQWLHAGYSAESVYNAANFTFWNATANPPPLAGYRGYPIALSSRKGANAPQLPIQFQQIPLWAEAIGADGYYPLAVLDWCGSNLESILPTVKTNSSGSPLLESCNEKQSTAESKEVATQRASQFVPESIGENSGIAPSLPWGILTGFIILACVSHVAFFWAADLWSPFTRDLAIDQNDMPHRRAVYLNISTSVLAAMAFITAFPLIKVGSYLPLAVAGHVIAWTALGVGCLAASVTFARTWRYAHHPRQPEYVFFNILAFFALATIVISWIWICSVGNSGEYPSYVGLYFGYRCLRPLSGLCPLLPVLLLLLPWYLWGIWQTARLRFSEVHRPRLPRLRSSQAEQPVPQVDPYTPANCPYPLYVADEVLEAHRAGLFNNHLYDNIQCLLITQQVILRVCKRWQNESKKNIGRLSAWALQGKRLDWILLGLYLALFLSCVLSIRIHGIDGFLFGHFLLPHVPPLYELLIMTLFFPLIMIALSGWLRMILIWGALSRDLLEPLERMPLRFAFTRYKSGGWMSMLRQKGLHVRWRDMGRSTEGVRQIVHHPELKDNGNLQKTLQQQYEVLNLRIHDLMKSRTKIADTTTTNPALVNAEEHAKDYEITCTPETMDLPDASVDLCTIYKIEQAYAEFSTLLVEKHLAEYWNQERTGFVDDTNQADDKEDADGESSGKKPPGFVDLAEEFLVVRYVALIRAVLINMRYLMLFVSAAFVLTLIAWNSYPFQPHAFIDWCFTLMLGLLTLGFVWVFAQMHRNAILSRITNSTANELGWEFYLRLAAFGAVPILTWLAYQFPEIGGSIYRIVQPGLQVVK
jgi:hypothetical protein